jgi:hemoglobin
MDSKRQFYIPPEGPPQDIRLDPEIYRLMGEENIFKMLKDFYHALESTPIRHLFPENMEEASKKSAAFFVFILGGPPLYHQRHGPPMMRKRHMAFTIDEE